MESNTSSLFELQVDHDASTYLKETARWAKFLGIMGFIGCGLCVIGGLVLAATTSGALGGLGATGFGVMSGAGIAIVYIVLALLYFFPCLYLFNFASKMQLAIRSNDQGQLNQSFKNLKSCFRFLGILTIIVLGLWGLGIIIAIIGSVFR